MRVIKRDCSEVEFDKMKISSAILKGYEKWFWYCKTENC